MPAPTALTFAGAEYAGRRHRVRAEMSRRDIDLLLVTSPSNLYYLCDYAASWYPPRLPVALALRADSEHTVFFDWVRHADHVEHSTLADEAAYYEYGESAAVISGFLAARGAGDVVALEWSSPTPSPQVVNELADALRSAGLRVESGDWIVDDVRLYKSPAELDRVRAAARIADAAMLRLQSAIRPGMTELEVSALATSFLAEQGGEVAAQNPLVSSGPTAWRDVHNFPSGRRLQEGDLISLDLSGVVDRYHANLARVFSLGRERPRPAAWLAASGRALQTFLNDARPDADPAPAMHAAEVTLRSEVPAENIWWAGGYSLGACFPPSWGGHAYLHNDGPTDVALREGWVSNFETVLVDRAEGWELAPIDTVVMTATGAEVLSALPRTMVVVPTT
ncbi:M24 family metallopeptidase [Cryptosporangium sp. NPDC051539]|uniref:M24 family metallopeptidase n=1 Tax=Cryptosporangium sp. NPDC051539 TaxID=3363962 RepID=UPI0037B909D8